MARYIDADKLIDTIELAELPVIARSVLTECMIPNQPTADVVEVGKPYFYEEGYVLKDFHNEGVHRYFVIERVEE